jgi:hydroxyacylglutathione hydrolase
VLISRVIASFFGTNCWILAGEAGAECVIVDPGIAVPDLVGKILDKTNGLGLKPVAALITHGHLDHTFSLYPLCRESGMKGAYVHPKDRELLTRPEIALRPEGLAMLKELAPSKTWHEPDQLLEVDDGEIIDVAGLSIEVIHAPGHTKGSIMFRVDDGTLLSGDVLFKGSIGRTDLPTGSSREMDRSLREKVMTLPDDVKVLPGHGDETTIGDEKRSNPYLLQLG